MAAMLILSSKSLVQSVHRLHALDQQRAHERAPLLADRSQAPSIAGAVFARNQPQVAGDLLAAREASDISQRHDECERGDRTDSRLRHQQPRLLVRLRLARDSFIEFTNLRSKSSQQLEQV